MENQELISTVQSPPMAMDKYQENPWYTADAIRQRVQIIQEIYRGIMKPDTHYGTIPGCGNKPTLLKAGSEQLLSTFKLAVRPEVLDLSTPDCARYRVTCHITNSVTGTYLGSGIGEASSDESKYKWREAVCPEEFEVTPADRRRTHWKKGQRGAYSVLQVRTEVADVANTVLKMAKKRGQIDGTLTVTAASDIFTQDLEDMEHPVAAEESHAESAPVAMPQRKSQSAPTPAPSPTPQRVENATRPAPAPIIPKPCPDCGEPLGERGCNACGWMPESTTPPTRPAAVQQTRQPNPTAQPPATRTSGGRKISEAQARRFYGIAMGNGITKEEQKRYLKDEFGIDSDRDLEMGEQYEKAVAWAQGN